MIKRAIKAIYQYKVTLLFLTFWAHVSLLNLFFVNYNGPVFLWDENSQLLTLQVHFSIAALATLFYIVITKIRQFSHVSKFKVGEKIWLSCSLVLLLSISLVLMI
jgi:hypothetical protein